MNTAAMDLDEYAFRAENCRRVAASLRDPAVKAELLALAQHYDEIAARLRKAAENGSKEPDSEE